MKGEAHVYKRDHINTDEIIPACYLVTDDERDGPVDALNVALRKALNRFYPSITSVHLEDYKVRVLETTRGTEACVRVLIESTNGVETWGTVGVSENVIEASFIALVDSLSYQLVLERRKAEKKDDR